ncbi:MAG: OmpA family protein [Oligoflexia bacterium]|nr:OmpA family protein [Oligoflexia bacterium]
MMKRKYWGFASCLLLFVAIPAFAEYSKGGVTLSPFVGAYLFDGEQHMKLRPSMGARLGIAFEKNMSVEAIFDYVESRSTGNDDRDIDVYRYGGDFLYLLGTDKRISPFLAAGGGVISIDNPTFPKKRSAGLFNYGPGLLWFFNDMLALRADLRHILILDSNDYANYEGTLGLTFLFGGEEEKRVETAPVPAPKPTPAEKPVSELENRELNRSMEVAMAPRPTFMEFSDVHFYFGKASITPEGKKILDQNIQILKDNPSMKIKIAGYASTIGPKSHNLKLSRDRAISVRNYLVRQGGISSERLKTVAYGETGSMRVSMLEQDE